MVFWHSSCTFLSVNKLKHVLTLFIATLLTSSVSIAQENNADTFWHVTMKPVKVKGKRVWENDTVRYNFNQTKYYVTTILPYLNEAVAMHKEMQYKIANEGMTKKQKRRFLKEKEEALRTKFDAEIKTLNETQGVLLIKLIGRQTGENLYQMLLDYKSTFTATKWLAWARIHGFSLNKQYNPNEEVLLEKVMESLDYPLPEFYHNG